MNPVVIRFDEAIGVGRIFIAVQACQGGRHSFVRMGIVAVDVERLFKGSNCLFIAAHAEVGLPQLQMQTG